VRVSATSRIAYIHIGTHKTGTTSIQTLLAENDGLLARAGIFVPRTARITPTSAGHHNLAWEINNPYQFDPNGGTRAALFEEIARADPTTVCISSEEFEFLCADPQKLSTLADSFRAAGYEPHAIVYLRPQATYIESLYAEIVKRWTVEFRDFLNAILTHGIFGESCFDYDRLVGSAEAAFGIEQVHVRAYRANHSSNRLLREFLGIICGPGRHALDLGAVRWPERLNPMLRCDELVAARLALLGAGDVPAVDEIRRVVGGSTAFAPLTLAEIRSVVQRFRRGNRQVARRHQLALGAASWSLVWRELRAIVTFDAAARARKRLARAIDLTAADLRDHHAASLSSGFHGAERHRLDGAESLLDDGAAL
jgi:hypothetical protein